tara:strand:- start:3401 stop:4303 length:903 start_codon:yes stop_codon:yes gene_type:complete
MGTPNVASNYLALLQKEKFNIVGIYTQPPRPKDRGMSLKMSPVNLRAIEYGIPVFTPKNFKNKNDIIEFKKLKPELVIVMAFGMLLPSEIIDEPKFGCINIHNSILPKWRGAAPVEHAIMNGDKKTGVTIFKINNALDEGPIIASESVDIDDTISKKDLFNQLNNTGMKLLINILPKYLEDKISLVAQDNVKAIYASKISSKTTKIDFFEDAQKISNKIRAFSPNPGAWFLYKNERFKIIKCKFNIHKSSPSILLNQSFHIGCKNGSIIPEIIQRQGKIPLNINDFVRGFNFKAGEKINE